MKIRRNLIGKESRRREDREVKQWKGRVETVKWGIQPEILVSNYFNAWLILRERRGNEQTLEQTVSQSDEAS